jgi:hypothetical protein
MADKRDAQQPARDVAAVTYVVRARQNVAEKQQGFLLRPFGSFQASQNVTLKTSIDQKH